MKSKDKASPEKEYYSIDEVMAAINKSRPVVYGKIRMLKINIEHFQGTRTGYISHADLQKIKDTMKTEWLAPKKERAK